MGVKGKSSLVKEVEEKNYSQAYKPNINLYFHGFKLVYGFNSIFFYFEMLHPILTFYIFWFMLIFSLKLEQFNVWFNPKYAIWISVYEDGS